VGKGKPEGGVASAFSRVGVARVTMRAASAADRLDAEEGEPATARSEGVDDLMMEHSGVADVDELDAISAERLLLRAAAIVLSRGWRCERLIPLRLCVRVRKLEERGEEQESERARRKMRSERKRSNVFGLSLNFGEGAPLFPLFCFLLPSFPSLSLFLFSSLSSHVQSSACFLKQFIITTGEASSKKKNISDIVRKRKKKKEEETFTFPSFSRPEELELERVEGLLLLLLLLRKFMVVARKRWRLLLLFLLLLFRRRRRSTRSRNGVCCCCFLSFCCFRHLLVFAFREGCLEVEGESPIVFIIDGCCCCCRCGCCCSRCCNFRSRRYFRRSRSQRGRSGSAGRKSHRSRSRPLDQPHPERRPHGVQRPDTLSFVKDGHAVYELVRGHLRCCYCL